ncbi:MAG: DUF2281 domain-containing protein [Nitrospinae bacterium]|nr:DUF2281 domain-containing protein [Nitrospinota bacterium]
MNTHMIENKINDLPENLQKEALDFIDFLINKSRKKKHYKNETFSFNWEGGLSDYKDKYSSVELQHKSTEWR